MAVLVWVAKKELPACGRLLVQMEVRMLPRCLPFTHVKWKRVAKKVLGEQVGRLADTAKMLWRSWLLLAQVASMGRSWVGASGRVGSGEYGGISAGAPDSELTGDLPAEMRMAIRRDRRCRARLRAGSCIA